MDGGCGRWVIGVVVPRAEGAAEGVDGLALEAEAYVGVDAGGDADVGVAEEFLDDDEIDALFQEQGGGGVSLPVLDDMLKESILVDLGYVDGKALAEARRNADSAPIVPDLLCDVLALEIGLRSLM